MDATATQRREYMGNLSYIDELGIGSDESTSNDDESNNDNQNGLNDSDDSTQTDDESKSTQTDTERAEWERQIKALEKRISDKDAYINELRKESQKKGDVQNTTEDEDDDFWSNPEAHYKKLKEQQRIQQMQIAEAVYANTVDGYWKVVNQSSLREAIASDSDFAETFNRSSEPYKVAYEHLTQRNRKKDDEIKSLKEQIRAEIMKELGVKTGGKAEAPPSMAKMSASGGSTKNVSDDGFASVFGSDY